jgi:membrane fusion protein, copper/silver efflux system
VSRSAWLAGILAASAAGGTGYWAGRDGSPVPVLVERARTESAHWLPTGMPGPQAPAPAKVTGPVVYYQDPDGKPVYSASPRTTAEGHDFRAVRASEDVRFDQARESEATSPDRAGHDVTGHGMAAHGTAAAGKPDGGARKVLYYRNPMGLPDTSTTPKKDSMGMDYIPVYAGEDEGGDVVTVSPGKVQRTGVRTETVERRVVAQSVRVPGTVALDERRVTVIATRSDAYVDHVEDVTTGDRVRKGQPLVHVYSPEINAAAAQLIANPGFDGARRRLQNLNVSEAVIDEMERTRKVPMAITWSSARDGVVLQRSAVEGMKAAAGDTLFRIGDISAVWVLADVPERDLAGVRVGQAVTVRLRSAPGRTFSGKVGVIYPHHAGPHRAAEPGRRAAAGHVRRGRDRLGNGQARRGGARRRGHRHGCTASGATRQGRRPLRAARGQGRGSRHRLRRDPRRRRRRRAGGHGGEFPDRRREQPEGGAEVHGGPEGG